MIDVLSIISTQLKLFISGDQKRCRISTPAGQLLSSLVHELGAANRDHRGILILTPGLKRASQWRDMLLELSPKVDSFDRSDVRSWLADDPLGLPSDAVVVTNVQSVHLIPEALKNDWSERRILVLDQLGRSQIDRFTGAGLLANDDQLIVLTDLAGVGNSPSADVEISLSLQEAAELRGMPLTFRSAEFTSTAEELRLREDIARIAKELLMQPPAASQPAWMGWLSVALDQISDENRPSREMNEDKAANGSAIRLTESVRTQLRNEIRADLDLLEDLESDPKLAVLGGVVRQRMNGHTGCFVVVDSMAEVSYVYEFLREQWQEVLVVTSAATWESQMKALETVSGRVIVMTASMLPLDWSWNTPITQIWWSLPRTPSDVERRLVCALRSGIGSEVWTITSQPASSAQAEFAGLLRTMRLDLPTS